MTTDKTAATKAVEEKARRKGMYLRQWTSNDPTLPDKSSYWLIDTTTELPAIVDPLGLEQIDEILNALPDKT
jgi:hypothetical protein